MDYRLSFGLFASFLLAAVGFWVTSEHSMAIGFSVLSFIWVVLLINPKSPIRRSCLSVSSTLSITVENYGGFPPKGNRQYLTVYKTLRALSPIEVDKIVLTIDRNRIIPRDWESHKVAGDESEYLNFNRPEWLPNGNHRARLIAYTPYGYSKSEEFTIDVRD